MDIINFIKEIAEIITLIAGAIGGYLGGKKVQEKREKQYMRTALEEEIVNELQQIQKYKRQQDGLQ